MALVGIADEKLTVYTMAMPLSSADLAISTILLSNKMLSCVTTFVAQQCWTNKYWPTFVCPVSAPLVKHANH